MRYFTLTLFALFVNSGARLIFAETPTTTSMTTPAPVEDRHWASRPPKYSLGYEASTSGATMVGQNVLTFGNWFDSQFGAELLVGFTKASDTVTQNQVTTISPISGTTGINTTYSGQTNPIVLSLGILPKLRAYRNDWFQVYFGALFALTHVGATSYKSGNVTVDATNPAKPNDQSIGENGYGTKSTNAYFAAVVGPRVGADLFIKSLPNVGIGFSGGMITTLTGDQDLTTNVRTAAYTVVDGVAQTPTSETDSNTTLRTKPGVSGTTVAIAGQVFNLFGSFTIHYVW